MGIGTSKGAYYEDEHHQAAAEWDPKYETNDKMVVTPQEVDQNKQMDKIENDELGGTQVDYKTSSPLVTITDDDINNAIGIGLAVSGGGLKTEAETVGSAALMYKGERYEGANHGFALGDILDKYPHADMKSIDQGFTTSKGRFVSREEAFDIAKAQNQIEPHVLPSLTVDSKMLLSEDLIQP